jgi:hypothetical protein
MNPLERLPSAAMDRLAKSWLVCHSSFCAAVAGENCQNISPTHAVMQALNMIAPCFLASCLRSLHSFQQMASLTQLRLPETKPRQFRREQQPRPGQARHDRTRRARCSPNLSRK